MAISEKLKELNIDLPNAPDPVGAYVAFKKINNLLFILRDSKKLFFGGKPFLHLI